MLKDGGRQPGATGWRRYLSNWYAPSSRPSANAAATAWSASGSATAIRANLLISPAARMAACLTAPGPVCSLTPNPTNSTQDAESLPRASVANVSPISPVKPRAPSVAARSIPSAVAASAAPGPGTGEDPESEWHGTTSRSA